MSGRLLSGLAATRLKIDEDGRCDKGGGGKIVSCKSKGKNLLTTEARIRHSKVYRYLVDHAEINFCVLNKVILHRCQPEVIQERGKSESTYVRVGEGTRTLPGHDSVKFILELQDSAIAHRSRLVQHLRLNMAVEVHELAPCQCSCSPIIVYFRIL